MPVSRLPKLAREPNFFLETTPRSPPITAPRSVQERHGADSLRKHAPPSCCMEGPEAFCPRTSRKAGKTAQHAIWVSGVGFPGLRPPSDKFQGTVCEKSGLALPWPRWHEAMAHDRIYDSRRRQTCSIFQGDFVSPWARVLPALAIILAACGPTVAQTQYSDVPVLVAAEDEDENCRSSAAARSSERVIGALQDGHVPQRVSVSWTRSQLLWTGAGRSVTAAPRRNWL